MPPSSFHEASIVLIPKLNKNTRKLQINILHEHIYIYICKIPQQNIGKLNPTAYKKDYAETTPIRELQLRATADEAEA